jgi:hypothetical protein
VIFADRREGGVVLHANSPAQLTRWQRLDSWLPLEAKILVPLVLVTLGVAAVFGYVLDREQESAARASAESQSLDVARSAVAAY